MAGTKKLDFSKAAFFACVFAAVFFLCFLVGLYSGAKRNWLFSTVNGIRIDVKLVLAEIANLDPSGEPIHFLQPSRKPGAGVTINQRENDEHLLLLSGYFDGGNELRLVRRDGSPVARWPVRFSEHFPDPSHLETPPQTDRNVDLHGALINPDGSVLFNYEYGGTVKLSRCGETVWTLAHPTHHSIEVAEKGGYWIPGRHYLYEADGQGFPPFTRLGTDESYPEDLILRVLEDGTVAERISVPRILYDNGLEPLMTANGYAFKREQSWERELVHVNKIGELPRSLAEAFPEFEVGDLVLSLRNYNLILVLNPQTWRVKWHQVGPWRRQHDPEFNADGTISIFNNNAYRVDLEPGERSNPATPRVSNIIKIDPATGHMSVVYGEREGQEFLTVIRGKHEPTPEGGFLITEFEAGRVFEVDAQGRTVWEYINRYDEDEVLEVTEARLYPKSYFAVETWDCPSTAASN